MSSFMDNVKERAELQAQHDAIWDQIYQRQREWRFAKEIAESGGARSDTNELTQDKQDYESV